MRILHLRCISFDSYIKPQPPPRICISPPCCISFDSYIKPQLAYQEDFTPAVVYLLIPTSNHNHPVKRWSFSQLYIFWFLHQTTTYSVVYRARKGCISFDSYIKPQLAFSLCLWIHVVYLLIPTSNHNLLLPNPTKHHVVYLLIPTSNHNYSISFAIQKSLYIFWFLHQTTTPLSPIMPTGSCISFDSYIKPQRSWAAAQSCSVVYLLIPTSNHNFNRASEFCFKVVYLLIPTSNHNPVVPLHVH